MVFADLLELPYDVATGMVNVDSIVSVLPDTPLPVATQLFADHGRKDEFQHQYGHLRLDGLRWTHQKLEARALLKVSMNPDFQRWFDFARRRTARFNLEGWLCIDMRTEVQEHWAQMRTWRVSPVFLFGVVVSSASRLHLVEGHTRVGTLVGLVENSILAEGSTHEVWLGDEVVA
jgi:hypothetical protein